MIPTMKKKQRTNKKRPAKRSTPKKKVSVHKLVSTAMQFGNQMAERAFPPMRLIPVPTRLQFDASRGKPVTGAGFAIDPAILNAWNNYGRI